MKAYMLAAGIAGFSLAGSVSGCVGGTGSGPRNVRDAAHAAKVLKAKDSSVVLADGVYMTLATFQYVRGVASILKGEARPRIDDGQCIADELIGRFEHGYLSRAVALVRVPGRNYVTRSHASDVYQRMCRQALKQ